MTVHLFIYSYIFIYSYMYLNTNNDQLQITTFGDGGEDAGFLSKQERHLPPDNTGQ